MNQFCLKFLSVLFAWLLALTTNAAPVEKITVHKKAPHFRVALQANPTTGYRWQLKTYDHAVIRLVDSQFIPSKKDLIGAGGLMIFTFLPVPETHYPKQTKLVFEYARPWEKDKKGKIQDVIVTFKETN